MQVSALQYPEFRRYFIGQAVSLVGTWMQSVAGAWLVLQLSHNSALALALFGAFSYGPVLIFGLYAGTLVDRYAHRDVLLLTQLVSLVGAAVYAALTATHVITLPMALGQGQWVASEGPWILARVGGGCRPDPGYSWRLP